MGSKRAQIEKKVSELGTKTKLDKRVVHSLVEQYMLKSKDKGLDRARFRDELMINFNLLDDVILDRLFHTMDASASSQHLKLDDYVMGMASFLTDSIEEKIKFCFRVFDLSGDGYITREKMYPFLKNSMVTKSHDADQDDAEEGIKELIEMALKKLDHADHDGRVSFKDFRAAVFDDKLLLEALGQCLPDEKCRCQYLKMMGDPEMNAQPVSITSVRRDKKKHRRARSKSPSRHEKHKSRSKSPAHREGHKGKK